MMVLKALCPRVSRDIDLDQFNSSKTCVKGEAGFGKYIGADIG